MYKYFFILLFIFFSISSTKAENIDKVSITGNKRLSSETIKIYGDIEVNKNYSDFDTNEILRKLYETELFENVKIKIAGNELLIDVKEYPFIDQLVIIGEKSKNLREQIIKNIKSKEKRSFIKSNLKSDIEIIKTLYSSRGYNSTNVEMKTKKVSENSFDLLIEIERGDKTKISSIKFIGNKKISSRKLRDVIASEEDKFWKIISNNTNFNKNLLELDTRLLRNFYKSTGFYDVRINSKVAKINDNDQAELTYIISEGTRYTINKISTNVDKVFDAEIFFPLNQIYKKYIGDYYSPFKVKKLLEDLDDLIDKNNLQFVEHNVQEEITKNSINIVLNI